MRKTRVLMAQCCHLPQFFYVVDKLRQKHPEWELSALVCDHPQIDFYLQKFPCFRKVCILGQNVPKLGKVDAIVFPLLNRGYWKIKRVAGALPAKRWETDYDGNLRTLTARRLYFSFFAAPHNPCDDFVRYLGAFPLRPLGKNILVIQSCHESLPAKVEASLSQMIPPDAKAVRLQREPVRRIWKNVRRQNYDSAVVFFSGEKGFVFLKCLPFLLRIPRILVVNENGQFLESGGRMLIRFLIGRILYGVAPPKASPRILLVQTEMPAYILRVVRRLKERKLFPRSEILLLCRHEDREQFESDDQVHTILSYSGKRLRDNLHLWKQIRKLDPDMACALFSGRPYFRKPKLLFLLLPIRRRLVFNAGFDCYDLRPLTFFWIFRKQSLLFDGQPDVDQRILLLQTENQLETIKAISILAGGKVVPRAQVSVFCPKAQESAFEDLPEVKRVITYDRLKPAAGLKALWKEARTRADVLAAIFSGRPVFRKHRLLFLLLPARHRLIFNKNLDCFYLGWTNLHLLLNNPAWSVQELVLKIARVPFFLPRFAYLLLWATGMKVRRAACERRRNG